MVNSLSAPVRTLSLLVCFCLGLFMNGCNLGNRPENLPINTATQTLHYNFYGEGTPVPAELYDSIGALCDQFISGLLPSYVVDGYDFSNSLPLIDPPQILIPLEDSILPMGMITISYQVPIPPVLSENYKFLFGVSVFDVMTGFLIYDLNTSTMVEEQPPAAASVPPGSTVSEQWEPDHPGFYLLQVFAQNTVPVYQNAGYGGPFSSSYVCFILASSSTDMTTSTPTASHTPTFTSSSTITQTPTNTFTISPTQKPRQFPTITPTPGSESTACNPVAPCP